MPSCVHRLDDHFEFLHEEDILSLNVVSSPALVSSVTEQQEVACISGCTTTTGQRSFAQHIAGLRLSCLHWARPDRSSGIVSLSLCMRGRPGNPPKLIGPFPDHLYGVSRSGLHCQYVQPPSVKTKSVQKLSGPVVDVSPSPQAQASAPETEKEAAAALADAAGETDQKPVRMRHASRSAWPMALDYCPRL